MIFPNRHDNHALESASERYVKYHLPKEWIFSKPANDYGIDLTCEVVLENKIKGYEFGIQLKSKKTENDKRFIIVKGIKRSSINLWLNSIKPIMLIVFIEAENKAYWSWISESSFDLTKSNLKFQLKINKKKSLNPVSSTDIADYVEKYYLEMLRLKSLPSIKEDYGWQLYLNKNYEEALPYLKKMQKTIDVLNAIAICYYKTFQYKKALLNINQALDVDTNNNVLLSNKASILIEFGDNLKDENLVVKGINIIEDLIDKGKVSASTYFNYGNALFSFGNYNAAIEVFKSVLEVNPNKEDAWKNLGMAYHKLGLYEKEIKCYDKSITINPFLIEAISSKAITKFLVYNDYKESLELLLRVVDLDENKRYKFEYPYIDFYISECYYKLEQIDKAVYWNNQGLKNSPTDDYFIRQKQKLINY